MEKKKDNAQQVMNQYAMSWNYNAHVEHQHNYFNGKPVEDEAEVKTQATGKVQKTEDAPKEELFKFTHPSKSEEEELAIHQEVKRLVSHQNIQVICSYLKEMAKEKKILLPPNPSSMYKELVRQGMPTGEGFGEKNFTKYYK